MKANYLRKSDAAGVASVIFLLYAVWANVTGWILSAVHMLNPIGYVATLVPLCYGYWILWSKYRKQGFSFNLSIPKKQFLHIGWILVLFVILIGALAHRPFGWDACAYRLPRVLRWLESAQWRWLNSADDRQDISALAYEWMIAPIYALTQSDRLLFVINIVPFALMPYLCWHSARALCVSWQWSKIQSVLIPLGFCYSLQAGGVSNDGIGAFFALMPIALLAPTCCLWISAKWKMALSILSIAILSAIKLTNVPLAGMLLLWTIWMHRSCLHNYTKNLAPVAVVVIASVFCSILPIAAINWHYTGHYSGDPNNTYQHQSVSAKSALIVNACFLLSDAISPNPIASRMNQWLLENEDLKHCRQTLSQTYPNVKYLSFASYGYDAASGPSFPILIGIPLLLLYGLVFLRKRSGAKPAVWAFFFLILISYLFFMTHVAVHGSQRHAAPYYPVLLLALFGAVSHKCYLLPKWLVNSVIIVSLSVTLINLFLSPVRPILPQAIRNIIDKNGGSFQFHQDAMHQGQILKNISPQRVYAITHWGASTHLLWPPFTSCEVIEINSNDFQQTMLLGDGMLYTTELAIQKRYGLSLIDFLRQLGKHSIVAIEDFKDPRFIGETGLLIHVDDLSKLPISVTTRLYPHK